MFFKSLKLLTNVKLKFSNLRVPNGYQAILFYSSEKDKCKSKPVLLNPDCKTALITGGVGGIGFATAYQLLCDKAKQVALIGTDTKKGADAVNYLNCTFGKSKAMFFKCNVKSKSDVEQTVNKVKCELKEIDILVNAAGTWDDVKWMDEMQTNLSGTIGMNLAAKDCMTKGNGVIVNIAGFPGLEPFPHSPTFAAFASGIVHFSRCIGHDVNYKRFGVRVTVLCVGVTHTHILNDLDKKMLTKEMGKDMNDFLKKACSQKPDACAKAVSEVIKFGPPGSVWFVEGSRLFYYDVPDYKKCLNLVSQFL